MKANIIEKDDERFKYTDCDECKNKARYEILFERQEEVYLCGTHIKYLKNLILKSLKKDS